MTAASITPTLAAAKRQHDGGQLAEAEALYRDALRLDPENSEALHLFGRLASEVGNPRVAVELIQRAVVISPENAEAWTDLGSALHACGCFSEAIAAHRQAIRLMPAFSPAWNSLGNAFQAAGEWEKSIAAYQEAVRLDPNYPAPQINLGNALEAAQRLEEAAAAHRAATRLAPANADIQLRLGNVLAVLGRVAEAVAAFQQAVRLDPQCFEARDNLATAVFIQGRLEESIRHYRKAIQLDPLNSNTVSSLSEALQLAGRYDEAIAICQDAVRLKPTATGYLSLENALYCAERTDEAIEACRQALLLDPQFGSAYNNLGNHFRDQGLVESALSCYQKAIELLPDSAATHSNLVYFVNMHADYDPAAVLVEAQKWDEKHGAPFLCPAAHGNDPTPDRRLRIGYVSADLRRHVVGYNLLPLLREHDHEQFEVFCYSSHHAKDTITADLRSRADHWREIASVSDDRAAEMIREDGIDILVDLALHTSRNRLPIFARKPAPVQATYLAYCGTSGLSAMDYRISDPYFDPPGTDLTCYSEKTIRLARSYWCYQPFSATPAISPLPALRTGKIVLGCLNNPSKVSESALELWIEILRAIPHSQLLLLASAGSSRERVAAKFAAGGLPPERLKFANRGRWAEYLGNWQRIDIGLDPFPYGGGITTCDALWMGVPVVSLSGKTAVGRSGLSILSNAGLPELVAHSHEEYLQIAVALAGDLPRLSTLRAGLRERMECSPLRDARGFAREIETAYREMWSKWCMRQRPEP